MQELLLYNNKPDKSISLPPVSVLNVPCDPIIGVVVYGQRGWIQRLGYMRDLYKIMSLDGGVERGNGWGSDKEGMTLNAAINFFHSVREKQDIRMYLFDSERELFMWLAE